MRRIFVSLFLFLIPGAALLQAQKPILKLETDSQRIRIGVPFQLKLLLDFPQGTECNWPTFIDSIDGNFDILKLPQTDTLATAPRTQLSVRYSVTAFKPGLFTIGPFPYRYAQQGILVNDTSNAVNVEVIVPEVDTTKGFKDIQGPVEVPLSWKEFIKPVLIVTGIVLAVVIITLIIVMIIRRRRARRAIVPEEPEIIIPPYDEAISALQQLKDENAALGWEAKLYYTGLTDILRRYLERVLEIPAPEMISDEILDAVRRKGLETQLQQMIREVLLHADLAKFAKSTPDEGLRAHDLDKVWLLVEKLRPQETEGGAL